MESHGTHHFSNFGSFSLSFSRLAWEMLKAIVWAWFHEAFKREKKIFSEWKNFSYRWLFCVSQHYYYFIKDLPWKSELLVWHKALLHVMGIKFIVCTENVLLFARILPLARYQMSEIPMHATIFIIFPNKQKIVTRTSACKKRRV